MKILVTNEGWDEGDAAEWFDSIKAAQEWLSKRDDINTEAHGYTVWEARPMELSVKVTPVKVKITEKG